MSRVGDGQELSDAVHCANAGMHVVTIRDAGGNALFWFECASREAAEFECGYFDAHGIEADSDSGPRRLVECRHDERLRRRPEQARARAHRLAAKG